MAKRKAKKQAPVHPFDPPKSVPLSTPQDVMDHPARLMPPSPAGWGNDISNNPVMGPEY